MLLKAIAMESTCKSRAVPADTSGLLNSSSWQMGSAKMDMPTLAGMEMSRVMRMDMEEICRTWGLSPAAMAPDSTGNKLVEMGTTKDPGRSKNFRALPSTPLYQSAWDWVKPAAIFIRSISTALSTKSRTLKKQDPRVMGTAKRRSDMSMSRLPEAACSSSGRARSLRRCLSI